MVGLLVVHCVCVLLVCGSVVVCFGSGCLVVGCLVLLFVGFFGYSCLQFIALGAGLDGFYV